MSILVNREAPNFIAPAVMPNGAIDENFELESLRGKYVVLFFWPLDFTFVCPTEIIAHNRRIPEFRKRDTELVGVSIDSQFTHYAWRNTPVEEGGIGNIGFPMVADVKHEIVKAYGVEHSDGVALRASYLIDRDGIVQHQSINNLSLGRNVREMLRIIDALQFHETSGEVCPAGWEVGEPGMKATSEGVSHYLAANVGKL